MNLKIPLLLFFLLAIFIFIIALSNRSFRLLSFFRNEVSIDSTSSFISPVSTYDFSNPNLKKFIKNAKSIEKAENGGKGEGRMQYELLRHSNPFAGVFDENKKQKELAFLKTAKAHSAKYKSSQEWLPIGPYNLGGRTRALQIDAFDPLEKTILAGAVSGGLWKSIDGGQTWNRTSKSTDGENVTCLVQDKRPGKGKIWYYGTGEFESTMSFDFRRGNYIGKGLFRSLDNGNTWEQMNYQINGNNVIQSFDFIWNIVIDESNLDQDEIYIAAAGGIYRSLDGGSNWHLVLGGTNFNNRYCDIDISSRGTVYATLSNIDGSNGSVTAGIFKSSDGVKWEDITPNRLARESHYRSVLSISPSNENVVYFVVNVPKNQHLLYKFTNGVGWQNLTKNLPSFIAGDSIHYDSQGSYNMVIKVRPDNENIVFLGGVNLYSTTNGFATKESNRWIGGYTPFDPEATKMKNHHPDQHSIAFFKNPSRMLSGHDGGISFTADNLSTVQWQSLNNGYITSQFYTVASNPSSASSVVVGGMQDNGSYSTNDAQNIKLKWERLLSGDGGYCAISNNGKYIYASSQYGRIYRLNFDSQGKYQSFARIDPAEASGYLFINPFILDPYNSEKMYLAAGLHIWKNESLSSIPSGSNDKVTTGWEKLENTFVSDGQISALALSKEVNKVLYYGTTSGRVFKLNIEDAESKSIEITGVNFPKYDDRHVGFVSCISVDPKDPGSVMVVFSNYGVNSIFHTENGGTTWNAIGGNLEENSDGTGDGPAVHWVSMLYLQTGKIYFLGTTSGLFSTMQLDGEKTIWTQEGESTIGNAVVNMVYCRQKDGKVIAATHGNGLYATTLPNSAEEDFQVLRTALHSNYPNPFGPFSSTVIPFELDEKANVSLYILDINGKPVKSIFTGTLHAGYHKKYKWDGTNNKDDLVAPGVYHSVLESNNAPRLVKRILFVESQNPF